MVVMATVKLAEAERRRHKEATAFLPSFLMDSSESGTLLKPRARIEGFE
jgi:hypothetical protein